jgi:hypothetical protein
MALDDNEFDAETASSFLKALREMSGVRSERDNINGYAYSTGKYFPNTANGSTRNVYIENPSNSGVVLFPSATFRSGGQITFHKIDSVTIDSAGTTLDPDNRLIEDGTSSAKAEANVSFSGGNPWTKKVSGGSTSGGGLAPGTSSDFDIIIQEGENVLYQLENVSGNEVRTTIDVDYVELDKNEFNELLDG